MVFLLSKAGAAPRRLAVLGIRNLSRCPLFTHLDMVSAFLADCKGMH